MLGEDKPHLPKCLDNQAVMTIKHDYVYCQLLLSVNTTLFSAKCHNGKLNHAQTSDDYAEELTYTYIQTMQHICAAVDECICV